MRICPPLLLGLTMYAGMGLVKGNYRIKLSCYAWYAYTGISVSLFFWQCMPEWTGLGDLQHKAVLVCIVSPPLLSLPHTLHHNTYIPIWYLREITLYYKAVLVCVVCSYWYLYELVRIGSFVNVEHNGLVKGNYWIFLVCIVCVFGPSPTTPHPPSRYLQHPCKYMHTVLFGLNTPDIFFWLLIRGGI